MGIQLSSLPRFDVNGMTITRAIYWGCEQSNVNGFCFYISIYYMVMLIFSILIRLRPVLIISDAAPYAGRMQIVQEYFRYAKDNDKSIAQRGKLKCEGLSLRRRNQHGDSAASPPCSAAMAPTLSRHSRGMVTD